MVDQSQAGGKAELFNMLDVRGSAWWQQLATIAVNFADRHRIPLFHLQCALGLTRISDPYSP